MNIISLLITLLFFASIGIYLSKKFKKLHSITALMIVIASTVIAQSVGQDIMLLGIDSFRIFLNIYLQSLGLGMLIGIMAAMMKQKLTKVQQENKAVQ